MRRHLDSPHIGHLLTPRNRNSVESILSTNLPWAVDNGAFSGLDEARFTKLLAQIQGKPRLLFVVAPDTVADANATLKQFRHWGPLIADLELPVALAAQDGLTPGRVPWDQLSCLFVGGSTDWRLGEDARRLAFEARDRGLHLHVGRVNTLNRIRQLAAWGTVDSIDGSGFSRWPSRIPLGLRWIKEVVDERDPR